MRPLNFGSTITIRTPVDLRAAIEAAAEREGASASEWIRRALAAMAGPSASPPSLLLTHSNGGSGSAASCP